MLLVGSRLTDEEGGHSGERSTAGGEECAARNRERFVRPCRSHHASPFIASYSYESLSRREEPSSPQDASELIPGVAPL
jgi:hypothetical protein